MLRVGRQVFGKRHPSTLKSTGNLATMYHQLGWLVSGDAAQRCKSQPTTHLWVKEAWDCLTCCQLLVTVLTMPLVSFPFQSFSIFTSVCHLHSPLIHHTSLIIQLYVLTFYICLLSIMLLVTGTSVLVSSHNLLCIYLCGAGLFSSLLSTWFFEHSLLSDLGFLFDLCIGSVGILEFESPVLWTGNGVLRSGFTVGLNQVACQPGSG